MPTLLFHTTEVLNRAPGPDGPAARCFFPAKKGGPLVWTPIVAVQLKGAARGQLADLDSGCTVSGKHFKKYGDSSQQPLTDMRGNPLSGSAMVRCLLMVTPAAVPLPYVIAPRPDGVRVGLGSGENVCQADNRRPYWQPGRSGKLLLPWDEPWVTLLVACASGDAREGNPVSPDYLEACAEHEPGQDDEYAFIDVSVSE